MSQHPANLNSSLNHTFPLFNNSETLIYIFVIFLTFSSNKDSYALFKLFYRTMGTLLSNTQICLKAN